MNKSILLCIVFLCICVFLAETVPNQVSMIRGNGQNTGEYITKGMTAFNKIKWNIKIENKSFGGLCLIYNNYLINSYEYIDKSDGKNSIDKSLDKRPGGLYWIIFNKFGISGDYIIDLETKNNLYYPFSSSHSLILYEDILYTLFYQEGRLYHDIRAYNFPERKLLWENIELREESSASYLKYPISIAVNDKYLYFANHESLYALDRQTGKLAWESKQLFEIRQGIMAGKKNVFVKIFKELSALDALTGKLVWKTKNTEKADGNLSLAYSNGVVFVKYNDFKKNGVLTAYDELTGAVLWESVNPEYFGLGEIVIADGVIHFCALKKVFGVDVATGKKLWEFVPEGEMNFTPFIEDGVLYFGTKSGYFYAIQ